MTQQTDRLNTALAGRYRIERELGAERFAMLRSVVRSGPAAADKLVQLTNWAAEVQAKLAAKAPK